MLMFAGLGGVLDYGVTAKLGNSHNNEMKYAFLFTTDALYFIYNKQI